jgi:exopolysaccharide biosynthesis polyprenyl glycosylphosphotransferase
LERKRDIILTLAGDLIALILVWYTFYHIRFELQWFDPDQLLVAPASVFLPAVVTALFWIAIFAFFGLYKRLYMISRFDEIIRVGKISVIGTLVFFFLLFTDDLNWNSANISYAKNYTFVYWLLTFGFVSVNRLIVRTIQKATVMRGVGLHKALIVGVGETARQVHEDIERHKATGLNVIGFIDQSLNGEATEVMVKPEMVLGKISEMNQIIENSGAEDVIVAMEPDDRFKLVNILDNVEKPNVTIKILPDFYQIISGLNQTNQIFGLPLIVVMPDPMPAWEKVVKRAMDVLLSLLILIVSLPVMLVVGLIIRFTSEGPVIFAQERVGLHGKTFTMYKFRSMFHDAEKKTGPTWAKDADPRITPVGQWLRKLRLDELPQLLNVLKGDMSLVGPRPERPYFVERFKKEIPLYTRRLRVRPGITGWAQVKWKYDESLDDVKEKTKYDLFYVENISLKMDLKILINTIWTMVSGKGQ